MRLQVPLIHRGNRVAAVIIGGVALVVLYLLPAHLQFRPPVDLDESRLDSWVPFLEWTIWIYASEYLLLFVVILCGGDDRDRSRTFYALFLAAIIGVPIFLLWPTHVMLRSPSFAGATGLLWRGLYSVDTAANALPSLHAANTCLAAARLWRFGGAWRFIAPIWAVLILVSTLTTKQHYAIDIVGGVALAAICFALVRGGLRFRVPQTYHGPDQRPG